MSWAKLDDAYPENEKIANLSDAAFRAHVSSICYVARNLTDGFVPVRIARGFAGRSRVMQELTAGLWHIAPNLCEQCRQRPEAIEAVARGDGFYVHDYLIYNPTRAEVEAEHNRLSEVRAQAGRRGAEARWHGKTMANEMAKPDFANGKTMAIAMANEWQNDGPVPDPDPDQIGSAQADPLTTPSLSPPSKRERRRALTEADIAELVDQFPEVDVHDQASRYHDWLQAKGNPHKDHVAGFRNWLRKARDDAKARNATRSGSAGGLSRADLFDARLRGG